MLNTAYGYQGAFTAPHRLATLTGQNILAKGGSAIEAMVAAAATIAVVYPHMNGIGGDGFWIIKRKGQEPIAIEACGQAAGVATPEWYAAQGHHDIIPTRGGLAALTVPGTIGGWQAALGLVDRARALSLTELLGPAISYAHNGIAVSGNQAACTTQKLDSLVQVPGFAQTFLIDNRPPKAGEKMLQVALGDSLADLAEHGLMSFYQGPIAAHHAAYLEANGSPLRLADFAAYAARLAIPLQVKTSLGQLYNMAAPTQGVSSLMILALFDRLTVEKAEGFDHLHGLIEATKQAFIQRNAKLGDPRHMKVQAQDWLLDSNLDPMVAKINRDKALAWPHVPAKGDTIWMGATDAEGTVVSFIQSVFWEFGSGLTCPETGVFFQNRGAGFSLAPGPNQLTPGHYPFHTLNPALAELSDGRIIAYGTMGGEGQPQTQAAVFSRYAQFGQSLQMAVTAPRWLLGRTWGDNTTSLKLEGRIAPGVVKELLRAGHNIEIIDDFSDLAGHAGAVVLHPNGLTEAASDPRSDGCALAF
ncbi:MAG: gamma-glutamyltransferase [Paracoccaceae bacterium]|jgi:gamma-glutamyltranspeptidase